MPKIRGFKPDLWTDERFVELSAYARLLWMGMWSYACDNGHLQDKSKQIKMRVLPTDDVNCAELLREIEAQGLIERDDDWITIPNLTHHQKPHKRWYVTCEKPGCAMPEGASYGFSKPETTVDQPLNNREQPLNNGGSTADVDVDGDGEGEVIKSGVEDDPAPPGRSLALVNDTRPDVDRICDHLADQIQARGAKRPSVTARWRNEARLLLDNDGRTEEQVHGAIRWLFTSTHRDAEFWRTNVRSMPKLRAEYDRLRELSQRSASGGRQQETDDLFERAARRMGVTNGGIL